jgi:hypothetical protein
MSREPGLPSQNGQASSLPPSPHSNTQPLALLPTFMEYAMRPALPQASDGVNGALECEAIPLFCSRRPSRILPGGVEEP